MTYRPPIRTTSGAPTTGTYSLPAIAVDDTGQVWVLTAAGTPGTWIAAGSGTRSGPAESATSFSTASTSYVDYTGLSFSVTADGVSGLSLVAYAPLLTCTSAAAVSIGIFEGATLIESGTAQLAASASQNLPVLAEITPSAGPHTYKAMMKTSAGTATSNTGSTFKAWLKGVRC